MVALKLVTREQWGARPRKYINRGELSAESTCHWEGPTIKVAGQLTWDHSKCASLVRGIQNFHMDGRGWSDIAYNFLVCPHGYTFEGRGLNVVNGANGTNTGNRTSHTVCCIAGEGNPFPEAEKYGFKETVKYIDANTKAPGTCKGHRDWKSTACPGEARYKWVHAGMPVGNAPPTAPSKPTTPAGHKHVGYPGGVFMVKKPLMKHAFIKTIQHITRAAGCGPTDKQGGEDGAYGNATKAAVECWQRKIGFTGRAVDGKWGPGTQKRTDAIFRALLK